jgi:mannose-6-phosphate isomerase-like protein (cupin superfamily)
MKEHAATEGYGLSAGEGDARWWLGSLAVIKATGQQTSGRYTLVEVLDREGTDGPLHVHHREDEGFWILEGELTFQIGEQQLQAGPGSFVFGPRGVPHSYRVDRGPARILYILSPAGFESFIYASSEPAQSLTLPPVSLGAPDEGELERLALLAEEHGAELLG